MENRTKNQPTLKKSFLSSKPLMLINFPNEQKVEAYEYLLNSSKLPKYKPVFDEETEEILRQNGKHVKTLLAEARKSQSKQTVKKLQEVALVKAYKEMHEKGKTDDFMNAVYAIYGSPDSNLFWSILEETIDHAYHNSKSYELLDEVQKLIILRRKPEHPNAQVVRTRTKIFQDSKTVFKKTFKEELTLLRRAVATKPWVHRYSQEELIELFNVLIKHYGLNKQGWVVETGSRAERAMVNFEMKRICVAPGSFRLSRPRAIGWALHEVSVHSFARPHISKQARVLGERRIIEEGLGVFVEQMVFSRFQPVRYLRYIALGLALGLDGKPRNAKEVYEIIWRLRYLGGIAKSKKVAKEYAAKEVIRIFRGMPLNQKGVVITKDRAYIEGNQLIWDYVEKNGAEFIFEQLLGKKL